MRPPLATVKVARTWPERGGQRAVCQYVLEPQRPLAGSLIEVAGTPARFAIAGPQQNPVDGEIVVRVELPPGPGRLELFDLQGRMLRDAQVSRSGAVSLGHAGGLGPGVYLLRLVQGSRVDRSRVCIVR